MKADIGSLEDLETTAKTSIVDAINELKNGLDNAQVDTVITMEEAAACTEPEKPVGVGAFNELSNSLPHIVTLTGDCDTTGLVVYIPCPDGFNEENCIALSAMILYENGTWYTPTENDAYIAINENTITIKFGSVGGWSKYRLTLMKIK